MKISVRKFFTSPLIFLFIVMAMSKPDSIEHLSMPVAHIWNYFNYLAMFLVLCVTAIVSIKKSRNILDIVFFIGYRIVVTLVLAYGQFAGDVFFDVRHLVKLLAFMLYISKSLRYEFDRTIKHLAFSYSLYTWANFISIIFYPDGMYGVNGVTHNWFLGYDNGHVVVLLPFICLALMALANVHNDLERFVLRLSVFIAIASVFLCYSTTSKVGIIVFILYYLIRKFPTIGKKIINTRTIVVTAISFLVLIVIFRMQNLVLSTFLEVVQKDITFTGRIYLWDIGIELSKKYFMFGIGDNSNFIEALVLKSGMLGVQTISYLHNEILDILVRSGIIGLGLYIGIIYKTLKSIRSNKDGVEEKILLGGLGSFWIMMMFESFSNYELYFLYYLLLIIPRCGCGLPTLFRTRAGKASGSQEILGKRSVLGRMDYPIPKCHNDGTRAQ